MKNTDEKHGASPVAGRFAKGNRAAVGNRGGGRPRKALAELLDEVSHESIRELRRIAFNARHPRHAEHAFDAVKELARLSTPRRKELTGEAGGALGLTFVEHLARLGLADGNNG